MATYTSFEQLPCWQRCHEVRLWSITLLKNLPALEMYELSYSIKKCTRSASRNLAEGFGKFTIPDKVKFCRTSKGSLHELIDGLITAQDEGYITNEQYGYGRILIEEALKSINGYINYLNSRKDGDWERL